MRTNWFTCAALLSLISAAWAQSVIGPTPAGNMLFARDGHRATLLLDGKVLITGGNPASQSAELYDPQSGRFTLTGSMNAPHAHHSATLLPDGRVLIVGSNATRRAEIYDPSTGTFSFTGPMVVPRYASVGATVLNDGTVLISGGNAIDGGKPVSEDEIFDPSKGTFSSAGIHHQIRHYGIDTPPTLFVDGRVLGGEGDASDIYDPVTRTLSRTNYTDWYVFGRGAALLPNGKVLLVGGYADDFGDLGARSGASVFNPVDGRFTSTASMSVPRYHHTTTTLPDGTILIMGGSPNFVLGTNIGEIYDPSTAAFTRVQPMTVPRDGHQATLLNDGRILITGGSFFNSATQALTTNSSAEIYSSVSSPALALLTSQFPGSGPGRIFHGAVGFPVSAASPASVGEELEIHFTGLLPGSVIPPRIAIGGKLAKILSFGDVPAQPGVNRVRIVVPLGVKTGSDVSVRLLYMNRISNQVSLAMALDSSFQQASDVMTATAGLQMLNFWQWNWYWQRSPGFPGAPFGFGVPGSIDNTPGLSNDIIAEGGGDGFQLITASQWVANYAVVSEPLRQASRVMARAAGTDRLNFADWARYWQTAPGFPGNPEGFSVPGSVDNVPGLLARVIQVGGGDASRLISAREWVLDYYSVVSDPWLRAAKALKDAAGTDQLNFWQWVWFWQGAPAFSGAPQGFGVPGSVDNVPGLHNRVIASGGGNGARIISAQQWVDYYRAVRGFYP